MSDGESSAVPPKEDPASFVLRGRARPVVRFRRGLIIGLCGGFSAIIVALAFVALRPPSLQLVQGHDSPAPIGRTMPDAIGNAPRAYSDVPQLGPPLPGDLGRPILERQRELSSGPAAASPSDGADGQPRVASDLERRRTDELSARTSPLIVRLGNSSSDRPAVEAAPPHATDAEAIPASTVDHKAAVVRSRGGEAGLLEQSSRAKSLVLSAGTIIPASLITGLNSDLPGLVVAQVTENVPDSLTGRTVLIPQGARLLGRYDNGVTYGQSRALLVWDRLIFPNGVSLALDKISATDAAGQSGLKDHVNAHEWQMLKGVVLSSLLGVGTELSLGGSALVRAIRHSVQLKGAEAGEQLVGRDLEIQPTLTVRPGWPVRALLDKDLVLPPYKG